MTDKLSKLQQYSYHRSVSVSDTCGSKKVLSDKYCKQTQRLLRPHRRKRKRNKNRVTKKQVYIPSEEDLTKFDRIVLAENVDLTKD